MDPEFDDFEQLQEAWKMKEMQPKVQINFETLARRVNEQNAGLRRTVWHRDLSEVGIAILLLPIWVAMGNVVDQPWTFYLMVPALLFVISFILIDRRRHPQSSPQPDSTVMESLAQSRKQMQHQIWLLKNVFWWYLLPFAIAMLAYLFHLSWQLSGSLLAFAGTCLGWSLFVAVIYIPIYWLNQRAVRKRLQPQLDRTNLMIAGLEEGSLPDAFADQVQNEP